MWQSKRFIEDLVLGGGEKEIYEHLRKDDFSEIVMYIVNKVEKLCNVVTMVTKNKSESVSDTYRLQGNDAFKSHNYQQALLFYNMALCFAPKNSRALKLAYSNRSALLVSVKQYRAAMNDIETCFISGCPDDLVQKLKDRKNKCDKLVSDEDHIDFLAKSLPPTHLLTLGSGCSNTIPCARKSVTLNMSGPHPKIIAAEDICVGTVVGLETAYVNMVDGKDEDDDFYLTCHYCTKPSFNLISCDMCCITMFCDENCKRRCFEEYHEIECQMRGKAPIGYRNLIVNAAIKLKNRCGSWDKYIEMSRNIGDKSRPIEPEEFLNENNLPTFLYTTENTNVSHGKIFNAALQSAVLIGALKEIGSYFPLAKEKRSLAMHATATTLMHLILFSQKILMDQVSEVATNNKVCDFHTTISLFPFMGKLKHSCDPNLLIAPMDNKAALLAIRPIPRGTELTISYIHHYLCRTTKVDRAYLLFKMFNIVCSCRVCSEKWGDNFATNYCLSESQKMYLRELDFKDIDIIMYNVRGQAVSSYEKLCKGLELFNGLQNTKEYKKIFVTFYRAVRILRHTITYNKILMENIDLNRYIRM